VHDGPVVAFSGGGTGGHLYPALAVADALQRLRPDVRIFFVGSRRGVEGRILAERGVPHVLLPVQGIDRQKPLRSLLGLAGFVASVARAVRLFRRERPEAVVVTGGYAGAPAGIAAALSGIPLVLQEQNAIPGMVTRLLSRDATQIHVAFPEVADRLPAGRERVRVTGNPVRSAMGLGRRDARLRLGLDPDVPLLLVVGGSQGALALNQVLLEALGEATGRGLPNFAGFQVLWATGPRHHEAAEQALVGMGGLARYVRTVPYLDEMPLALAAADLALARAGATFTAEMLVHGLPGVLVPLPSAAEDHQTLNARALEVAGAAVVLPQRSLTGALLLARLEAIAADPDRLRAMSRSALRLARPSAARDIAAAVEGLLSRPGRPA